MSSKWRKMQQNADDFMIKEYFKNMTPETYQQGIKDAIRITENRLTKEYDTDMKRMANQYNQSLREATLIAMDTLATEMVYELGNILNCYVEEPEYLDQKIDVVQGIYETAMTSIEGYATAKYKNDKQAQKAFEKKKKTVQRIFGMEMNNGKTKHN